MNYKQDNEYDGIHKIMLIGDSGSGKTSILVRFSDDIFNESYVTLGQDFKEKIIRVKDKNYKFLIWDTAGQERFRTICHSPYRGAVGIIIVYDVTDFQTFDNVKRWLSETERYCLDGIPVVVFGNKIDMVDVDNSKRQVSEEQARQFTELYGTPIFETSAKYNINIESGFLELTSRVIEYREGSPTGDYGNSSGSSSKSNNSKKDKNNNNCTLN